LNQRIGEGSEVSYITQLAILPSRRKGWSNEKGPQKEHEGKKRPKKTRELAGGEGGSLSHY